MTPDEQLTYFDTNGYLNRGPVLTAAEVEAMRDGLDRVISLERGDGDDSSVEFKYGHDREGDAPEESGRDARAIHQYVNMWKRDPAYEAAIHNPKIAATACRLLRTPRVRLWHDQVISKPPGDNAHFGFHQDFYFWPLGPPNIVSCWLALDDATVDTGCMHVIPESHADPRFSPEAWARETSAAQTARDEGRPAEKTERDRMREADPSHGIPVELAAGDCMFHHCLNFHGTPPNVTDRQRRAFVMIFMAEGVRYNHAQSPGHILVPTIEVADGEPLVGDAFPVA
ncbi:phytanoyl-CoA dioxygenase family protein [Candidatus Poribacteria bacterium]|jgi:phytanoyl-CoA hydroxylase|nr:phytanoyl-CoA dioxygenase family protein [Candidatus Poribacteria bacterium]MBT5536277.1 phytanoyl-CoA dioxygenase family protein [Candidatus Poribacteria bacterium]MBT5713702.1 phytanoyl-CoA dioxygenase family protein [Candidatus Poribacteria bacterium]MBT7806607.1 phytanoyl-CoA dioxygenase family protein [Candidatus Poribacteria bacterium]